jgi:hypothetical protein
MFNNLCHNKLHNLNILLAITNNENYLLHYVFLSQNIYTLQYVVPVAVKLQFIVLLMMGAENTRNM